MENLEGNTNTSQWQKFGWYCYDIFEFFGGKGNLVQFFVTDMTMAVRNLV